MHEDLKNAGKKDIIQDGWKVSIPGNRCFRCGHEWRPRDINVRSTVCPACKSPYWDKPKKRKDNANG